MLYNIRAGCRRVTQYTQAYLNCVPFFTTQSEALFICFCRRFVLNQKCSLPKSTYIYSTMFFFRIMGLEMASTSMVALSDTDDISGAEELLRAAAPLTYAAAAL